VCAWWLYRVSARQVQDEFAGGQHALDSSFSLVICDVSHVHPVERSRSHADHVLLTEAAPAVLARHQEAALVAQLCTAVAVAGGQQQRHGQHDHHTVVGHEQLVLSWTLTHKHITRSHTQRPQTRH